MARRSAGSLAARARGYNGDPEERHARYDGHRQAAAAHARAQAGRGPKRQSALRRAVPALSDHRLSAPARAHALPYFAFEYCDGGSGNDDVGITRNWAALDAVELVPRYGVMPSLPSCEVELFGRRYAAPIGIAPMGGPAVVWPGADIYLARAAQRARVPYTLGTVGCATIEKIAESRARRVLVPALPRRPQRSRHRLRSRPSRARPRAAMRWC